MNITAIAYAFLSAVLMGTIGVFSKILGLPAEIITFFRLIIGAGFMMLFLTIMGNVKMAKAWPTWPVLVNGVLLAGFIIFYVQAMNYTTMANAIMLVYLAPLVASVVAHFYLGERLTYSGLVLIFLALFGFGMMMEFKIDIGVESREFIGICYGLLALACYAGFIVINRIINPNVHIYTRTLWQLLIGSLILIPFVISPIHQVSRSDIPWLLAVGFLPGFLAILFAVTALSRLPVAVFGTIAYFEPISVVIFGWTIFDEILNQFQISGCLLIIMSGIIKTMATGRRV